MLNFVILYTTKFRKLIFMGKYILQKQDYEDISFLINISKSIKDIYKELNETENKFGKDSDEYKKCLERLKSLLNLENNIYDRLKKDFYKCDAIVNYLRNSEEYKEIKNIYDLLLNETYDMEMARIVIKLDKFIVSKRQELTKDEYEKKQINEDYYFSFNISSLVILDTLRCFLAVLKKDKLNELSTYMKYKVSYLFSEIEEEFLDNSFEIDSNPYVSAQLYCDLFNQNEQLLMTIRTLEFIENVNNQLEYFLSYSNLDLENPEIKNNLFLRTYFLRAILIFVDNETVDKMYGSLKNYIDTESNYYVKDILNLFCDSFNHSIEDCEIPKTLTLKKL